MADDSSDSSGDSSSSYGLDDFLRQAEGVYTSVTQAQIDAAKVKAQAQVTTAQATAAAAQQAATNQQVAASSANTKKMILWGAIGLAVVVVLALVFRRK